MELSELQRQQKIKADIFIDIQGDEPLIDPKNIDSLIKFHKKK